MKVTEHIEKANGKTLFSFEILPPLKGQNINLFFDAIDPLLEYAPNFINVTYHREEYEYVERENGLLERRVVRKRPGTVGICAAIQNRYHIDAIPHILCGGKNNHIARIKLIHEITQIRLNPTHRGREIIGDQQNLRHGRPF